MNSTVADAMTPPPPPTPPWEPPDRIPPATDTSYSLEAGGWLDYPPHFKGWRRGQEEAVAEIVAAFEGGARTVLVDGPTGVGKTWLGVGVRAALNTQTTYSCHSLALQDQWADDFAPYPMLKGRSNYDITFPGVPHLITAADCTWDAGNPERGCAWCPDRLLCPYEKAKKRALAASFRCVNHSYLVTEARHVQRFKHPLLILDEAELVEDAILQQVEVTFTAKLRDELNLGKPRFVTKEESILEWLKEIVIPALEADFRAYPRDTEDRRVIRQRNAAESRMDQTRFVAASYGEGWVFDHGGDNWSLRPVWASHWGRMWLADEPKKKSDATLDPNNPPAFDPDTEKAKRRILAMSATLISGQQVAQDLGLPEPHVTVKVDGGFDAALRPVYIAGVADLRSQTEESADGEDGQTKRVSKGVPVEQYDRLAMALRAVMARHPRDRILVHCHSYKIARELWQRVGQSSRVLVYEGGGRDKALEEYLKKPAAVLLAASLERGVNLPDDKCRVIVIAKVPFPYLGDPVVQKRRWSGGPTGQRWYAVETIRAIVQGVGRGMRHKDDFCETYVLDAAFMSLWKRDRQLFPKWFSAALVMNFNVRQLVKDGEKLNALLTRAREARRAAGIIDPVLRAPIVGRFGKVSGKGSWAGPGNGRGGGTTDSGGNGDGGGKDGNHQSRSAKKPAPSSPSLFDDLTE